MREDRRATRLGLVGAEAASEPRRRPTPLGDRTPSTSVVGQPEALGPAAGVGRPARCTPTCSSGPAGAGKRRGGPGLRRRAAGRRPARATTPNGTAAWRWPRPIPTSRSSSARARRISRDQVRRVVEQAVRSPVEGDRKVLLLTEFHLVLDAAPILLKSIEEPPPSTIFLILADEVPPELVTIASRCVVVPFHPLAAELVVAQLVAEGVAPDDATAGGRRGRAATWSGPGSSPPTPVWRPGSTRGARCPERLDGRGSTVTQLVGELTGQLDEALAPLDARHRSRARGPRGADRALRPGPRVRSRRPRTATSGSAAGSAPTSCASGWPCWPAPAGTAWRLASSLPPVRGGRPVRRPDGARSRSRRSRRPPRRWSATPTRPAARGAAAAAPSARVIGRSWRLTGSALLAFVPAAAPPAPARVAQSAERFTRNEQVKGSIPFSGSSGRHGRLWNTAAPSGFGGSGCRPRVPGPRHLMDLAGDPAGGGRCEARGASRAAPAARAPARPTAMGVRGRSPR